MYIQYGFDTQAKGANGLTRKALQREENRELKKGIICSGDIWQVGNDICSGVKIKGFICLPQTIFSQKYVFPYYIFMWQS